jgi:hypothetical protein
MWSVHCDLIPPEGLRARLQASDHRAASIFLEQVLQADNFIWSLGLGPSLHKVACPMPEQKIRVLESFQCARNVIYV